MTTDKTEEKLLGFHPSEFIQDELDARGWSLDTLAALMTRDDVARNRLALDFYMLAGPEETNLRIGENMAQGFSVAFGISAEFFINLENAWLKAMGVAPKASGPSGSDKTTEAVARALCLARLIVKFPSIAAKDFQSIVDCEWDLWKPEARAAIKAHTACLMEPSDAMISAGMRALPLYPDPDRRADQLVHKGFQAMLSAQEKTP